MKNLKRFYREGKTGADLIEHIAKYLEEENNQNIREQDAEAEIAQRQKDHVYQFEETFTCATGAEAEIANKLRFIPNEWVVIDAKDGGPLIRGTSEWTQDKLYLANIGAVDGEFKVRFSYTGER